MASRQFRAFGMLLLAGSLAGFCLSSGSAHYFAPATDKAAGGGGGDSGGGGGGNGGGKQASEHGGIEQEGKRQIAVGTAGSSGGTDKAGPEKAGAMEDAEDAKVPTPKVQAPPYVPNEIVEFLAGNTVELQGADHKVLHRYMSKRGWQGDTDGGGRDIVVHRYLVRANQLCEIATEQNVVCDTLTITREAKPGKDLGAKLGTVTMASGSTWPVVRGNVARLPETMPLIDGVRRLRKDPAPAIASAKGAPAFKALIGHPLVREAREDEPVSGVFYDPDGRWVTTAPLTPGARTGLGGIRVVIGQWAIRDGALCLDEPGLALTRKCYAAEQMGDAAFRLVPAQKGAVTALSVIAEGV